MTHEDISRELREWCERRSEVCRRPFQRKFFYLFTCQYCFSHYVAAFFIALPVQAPLERLARPADRLVRPGVGRQLYMSLFGRLRLDIKRERVEIEAEEAAATEPKAPRSRHGDRARRQRASVIRRVAIAVPARCRPRSARL